MEPRTESRAGPTRSTRSMRWACRTSTVCSQTSSALGWTRNGSAPGCSRSPPNRIRSTGCGTAADSGEGRFLDTQQVRAEVNSPTYLAGLFSPDSCAIVHPAKLAFELARACTDAGVQIYERTNATGLDTDGSRLAGGHRNGDDHGAPGGAGDERLPEPAATQPAAHRARVRLRAGHRAAHRCAAGPHRMARQAGNRRLRQPVSLLPPDHGQPHRVGRL